MMMRKQMHGGGSGEKASMERGKNELMYTLIVAYEVI